MLLRDATSRTRKLKIFSAKVVAAAKTAPGEILPSDGSIVVGANDGALSLGEVQLEGKRRMRAEEFLRGRAAPLSIA